MIGLLNFDGMQQVHAMARRVADARELALSAQARRAALIAKHNKEIAPLDEVVAKTHRAWIAVDCEATNLMADILAGSFAASTETAR